MCTFTSMLDADCPNSRAGIREIYVSGQTQLPTTAGYGVTWGSDEEITALALDTGEFWIKIVPAINTAFVTQELTKIRNASNVIQTLTFNRDGLSIADRKAMKQLNDCCRVNVVVITNAGVKLVFGLSYVDGTATNKEYFRVTAGFANTGTDPNADSAEAQLVMSGDAPWFAPVGTFADSALALS